MTERHSEQLKREDEETKYKEGGESSKRLCAILSVLGIPDVIGNTVLSKPPASGGETGLKF